MLHYTQYILSTEASWVTFVHGAGGSSAIWYKQLRDFKKSFNVLLIDLRGHGKSKNHPFEWHKKYSFSSIGNEVIEVLDYLKIKKSHFIGISLGTIIIREISERYPARVSSMILAGAVMKLNLKGQVLMYIGDMLKSVLPYLLLYKIFAFVILPRKTHSESRNLFINEAKKLYQKEFQRWFSLVSQVNPLLRFFRIHDSGIKTLYLMGAEDYMFLPSIQALVKNHRLSTLAVIPNSGHVVNIDQPQIFNDTAIRFFQSI
jgi:pimeloyl-ACP methyl ester carboxylesterase